MGAVAHEPSDGGAGRLARGSLHGVLERIHDLLARHRSEIDDLNVFPVPDGDTGTNMTLTVRSALSAFDELDASRSPDDRARAIARAAMRGARGNSGVILSQVLRALVEAVTADGPLDAAGYARALDRARRLAYEAIADPVEGTILTAIRAAADAAGQRATASLVDASVGIRDAVHEAVAATRDQLEANRVAGVVDAGARGFELVLDAIHAHLIGTDVAPRPTVGATVAAVCQGHEERYGFEVQYVLDAPDSAATPLRTALSAIGDSVAVVATDGLVSVHVHTDDVGPAIEAGLEHGRPRDIQVMSFAAQIAARTPALGRVAVRCVAVLPGGALPEVARAHDAVAVVGAAGALPSVADLLDAIEAANADHVVVLPGHRNVVPTAQQAAAVALEQDTDVTVIETADDAPSVLAALAVCDVAAAGGATDEIRAAAAAVTGGEVVSAVRDASTPIGPVSRGQLLAVVGGDVVAACDDPLDALRTVLDRSDAATCEVLMLIVGADVVPGEREKAIALARDVATDAEIEVIDGGQRPARYVVGIE